MSEKLQNHSTVVLFGKVVDDLKIEPEKKSGSKSNDKPQFARIYGFSYGGAYYEMASATLLVVHGNGTSVSSVDVPGPESGGDKFIKSLKAWEYDRTAHTMRMDMDSGSIEELLLGDTGDGGPGMSGARVSGARVSGARVSGARVSGARVSGARVSGARVSGARVSGLKSDADD